MMEKSITERFVNVGKELSLQHLLTDSLEREIVKRDELSSLPHAEGNSDSTERYRLQTAISFERQFRKIIQVEIDKLRGV